MASCRFMWGKRIHGNGNIKTVERSVSGFKDVDASGIIHLYISQGPAAPVKIETDENLLDYIEIHQEGDRISIKSRDGYNLDPTDKIRVYVTAPVYHHIGVSGAGSIQSTAKLTNPEALDIDLSGAGGIKMDLDAPAVKVGISGAGSATLTGQTKDLEMDISGAGNAHCFDLLSENTQVDISGAGKADVYASMKLNAQVSGAGNVNYKGGATNISQDVSGAGKIRKAD
jgi:Putative auto-transporter adhesin, head GIN domain